MKLLALVQDREQVRRFLTYQGEPADPPVLAPARGPPWRKSTVVRRRYSANLELFAS